MPDSSKLLHCPFCAGEAKLEQKEQFFMPYRCFCLNSACGASTPWTRLKEVAVAIWNRRPKRKPAIRIP